MFYFETLGRRLSPPPSLIPLDKKCAWTSSRGSRSSVRGIEELPWEAAASAYLAREKEDNV